MQLAFGFGFHSELLLVRDRLRAAYGPLSPAAKLQPIGQLVKSLLGARTRDETSWRAYERLLIAYPKWSDVCVAETDEIEAVISEVTFADVKALRLKITLQTIAEQSPEFDLNALALRQSVKRLRGWKNCRALAVRFRRQP